jgi:PIN domain nuclease of toxin-antitoxin system
LRILLDTHAFLWFTLGDPLLSAVARALIEDPGNQKLVSPATYWEIAIKVSINKLFLNAPYEDFLDRGIRQNGFTILPIETQHTAAVARLPFHHKDPFDRLLVAQALTEGIPIVSADALLDPCGVRRLW